MSFIQIVQFPVLYGPSITAKREHVWRLRHRLPRTPGLTWFVLAPFAAVRFDERFLRSDSRGPALGLSNAQLTGLAVLLVVAVAWPPARRRSARASGRSEQAPSFERPASRPGSA